MGKKSLIFKTESTWRFVIAAMITKHINRFDVVKYRMNLFVYPVNRLVFGCVSFALVEHGCCNAQMTFSLKQSENLEHFLNYSVFIFYFLKVSKIRSFHSHNHNV